MGPRAAGKKKPGERLPARVWNPFARPSVFSQGEVGGPGLPTPQHHLFPVYLFILKSHPPTLLGAPNIPVSLQRGAKGTGIVKPCWIRQTGLMPQLGCPCHVAAVPHFMLEASLWAEKGRASMTTISKTVAQFRSSVLHFISADADCTSLTVHQDRAPEPSPGPGLVWVSDTGALPEINSVLQSSSHLQGRHSHMKHRFHLCRHPPPHTHTHTRGQPDTAACRSGIKCKLQEAGPHCSLTPVH